LGLDALTLDEGVEVLTREADRSTDLDESDLSLGDQLSECPLADVEFSCRFGAVE
jgi:hypothetical protein